MSEFSQLELKDIDHLINSQKPFSPFSEASIANQYCYRKTYQFSISCDWPDCLIGKSRNGQKLLAPLHLPINLPNELIRKALAKGFIIGPYAEGPAKACLSQLPEEAIVKSERNSSDFVYDVADLAELDHSKYSKIRQYIRKLYTEHDVNISVVTEKDTQSLLECARKWSVHRDNYGDVEECIDGIKLACDRKIQGIAVRLDGHVQAFILFDTTIEHTVIALFLKFSDIARGLGDFCYHLVAKHCPDRTYLNICQDLGIPGLRRKKLALKPIDIIAKHYLMPGRAKC